MAVVTGCGGSVWGGVRGALVEAQLPPSVQKFPHPTSPYAFLLWIGSILIFEILLGSQLPTAHAA